MFLKNKKVLITGGLGFIGSHLSERFLDNGDEVIILDNFSTGHSHNLDHVASRIELVECDISKNGHWQDLFENIDYVITTIVVIKHRLSHPVSASQSR